jgi:hypothetical protein
MQQATPLARGLDRRRFLLGSAVAGAGATTALAWPALAKGGALGATSGKQVVTAPEPIVSVIDPGLPIHVQLPGPTTTTLLYSQTTLFGLNLERTTVGNFRGTVAWGYLLGTAAGSDGTEYGLEVDLRVSEGEYEAADGQVREGLFALI